MEAFFVNFLILNSEKKKFQLDFVLNSHFLKFSGNGIIGVKTNIKLYSESSFRKLNGFLIGYYFI